MPAPTTPNVSLMLSLSGPFGPIHQRLSAVQSILQFTLTGRRLAAAIESNPALAPEKLESVDTQGRADGNIDQ